MCGQCLIYLDICRRLASAGEITLESNENVSVLHRSRLSINIFHIDRPKRFAIIKRVFVLFFADSSLFHF